MAMTTTYLKMIGLPIISVYADAQRDGGDVATDVVDSPAPAAPIENHGSDVAVDVLESPAPTAPPKSMAARMAEAKVGAVVMPSVVKVLQKTLRDGGDIACYRKYIEFFNRWQKINPDTPPDEIWPRTLAKAFQNYASKKKKPSAPAAALCTLNEDEETEAGNTGELIRSIKLLEVQEEFTQWDDLVDALSTFVQESGAGPLCAPIDTRYSNVKRFQTKACSISDVADALCSKVQGLTWVRAPRFGKPKNFTSREGYAKLTLWNVDVDPSLLEIPMQIFHSDMDDIDVSNSETTVYFYKGCAAHAAEGRYESDLCEDDDPIVAVQLQDWLTDEQKDGHFNYIYQCFQAVSQTRTIEADTGCFADAKVPVAGQEQRHVLKAFQWMAGEDKYFTESHVTRATVLEYLRGIAQCTRQQPADFLDDQVNDGSVVAWAKFGDLACCIDEDCADFFTDRVSLASLKSFIKHCFENKNAVRVPLLFVHRFPPDDEFIIKVATRSSQSTPARSRVASAASEVSDVGDIEFQDDVFNSDVDNDDKSYHFNMGMPKEEDGFVVGFKDGI
eukprot:TRINITY_DN26847_c0_g1_i2.p1 TRINITY_DN26847_c0_g1~~TRINITY_DN26847_c0_g1_i2.p1  ORF type:complete len:559 (-),score=88.67 TRINITY_DN26847_c0_g1_i2:239-1915(-)